MQSNIPLCRPSLDQEDIELVADVLKSGWLAHGRWNVEFENKFSELIGVKHAIAMNSCTSALEVSLKINKIKGEVIIPSMTWVATANAVINCGATPVFCEVCPDTRNVNVDTIRARINDKTEAVIAVHFAGQPCNVEAISRLCYEKNLLFVEDSAETLGVEWNDIQAGASGIGCFSFFPTKNITTCEGGMLTCNDDDFASRARALIAHGVNSTTHSRSSSARPWERDAIMAGHNYRMPDPLAALGVSQLRKLNEFNAKRRALADRYNEYFRRFDHYKIQTFRQ